MPISSCRIDPGAFSVRRSAHCILLLLAVLVSLKAEPLPALLEIEDNGARRIFERAAIQGLATNSDEIALYERGVRRTEASRRLLTARVLVQIEPGADAQALGTMHGTTFGRELAYAPGHFIARAATPRAAWDLAARLREAPGIISADPILARKRARRFVPNDPFFPKQWHLLNTGQRGGSAGADIRVTNVWNSYRGAGVVVAVVDDGVAAAHPDLAGNVDDSLGIDVRDLDSDASPDPGEDWHGTAVAGLIAARAGNGLGGAGVAFESTLVPVRVLGGFSGDDEEAEALSYLPEAIQVSNNSWGAEDDGETLGGAGKLVRAALEHGAKTGRNGLGTIYVFAAGNGGELDENANYDTYGNSIYTIAVGAINDRGQRASYSEPGASLAVVAPGGNDASRFQGITTTDLEGEDGFNFTGAGSLAFPELDDLDFTENFSGTSAAAPIVSGVIALMLQANPGLGWRDVQEILLRTAAKVQAADPQWFTNRAGFRFNPDFGAGLVDAGAAVQLAKSWSNLPLQATNMVDRPNLLLPIPTNSPAGIEVKFEVPAAQMRAEHVTVMTDILIGHRGTLALSLVSPSGIVAKLAAARSDPNPDYNKYTFSSLYNWGENPSGTWTLRIADTGLYPPRGPAAILRSARLQVYGSVSARPAIQNIRLQNETLQLTIEGAAGKTYILQSSADFISWTDRSTHSAAAARFDLTVAPQGGREFFRLREQ